jgi:hypothetical protein
MLQPLNSGVFVAVITGTVAELADAGALISPGGNTMQVRLPPNIPNL